MGLYVFRGGSVGTHLFQWILAQQNSISCKKQKKIVRMIPVFLQDAILRRWHSPMDEHIKLGYGL